MINKGEHIKGVEPAGTDKKISYEDFVRILRKKVDNDYILNCIIKYVNKRDVYDCSGYSGCSTIVVYEDDNNQKGYVIKFQPDSNLKDEYISYNYFYKNGLTSKPCEYFKDKYYEIMITERINHRTATKYFDNYKDVAKFMGKALREYHDKSNMMISPNKEEDTLFKNKFNKIYEEAINTKEGLIYISEYMNNYDYDSIKNELVNNRFILNDEDVLLHGDFSTNNIFVDEGNFYKFIDFKDTCYGDRHYDVFWAMWTTILFCGIMSDKEKSEDCENIFLKSYGLDLIDDKKLNYCKLLACMYWKQHDEVSRFDESKYVK